MSSGQSENDFVERMLDDPLVELLMAADRIDRPAMISLLLRASASCIALKSSETPLSGPQFPHHSGYRRGVGVMLLNAGGQVFVGRRIDQTASAWQMPQGGIDGDETPRQAALRELREETGVTKVEVLGETSGWLRYDYPPVIAALKSSNGQQQKWFAMLHLGSDSDINVVTEHPEFSSWRWSDLDQLPSLIVAFKRQLYSDVTDAFAGIALPAPP